MIYTEGTKKALKVCFEAHKEQVDKSGMPYVFHPFHLAEQMQTEETTVVALLHDLVEDTNYTIEDLTRMGFSKNITDAIALMTHADDVEYMDYVRAIKENPLAKVVKLADLKHNSDLSRLDVVDEKALRRREKYLAAIKLLEDELPSFVDSTPGKAEESEKKRFMNFAEIARNRQSCRSYDPARMVEEEKLDCILEAARLSPSACNGQPYQITVCKGEAAKKVARATQRMGMNKFATDAPLLLVLSEMPYVASAALGARVKKNDYRSIDIGILAAYITAEATAQGLGSCILGWLEDQMIREICALEGAVRLVITLGYASADDRLRAKKRKDISALIKTVEE